MKTKLKRAGYGAINATVRKRPKKVRTCPTEHYEQTQFIKMIRNLARVDARYEPIVDMTFASANGGVRSKVAGAKLKAEGVKKYVPDIQVAYPMLYRADAQNIILAGLWIEVKALDGSASKGQLEFIDKAIRRGYRAVVCHGAGKAFDVWKAYADKVIFFDS